MKDIETIRMLLDDARLEHKASCHTDPCPAANRWEHEALTALDRMDAEIERLKAENERLKAAYARLAERLRLATPQSLMCAMHEEDYA